MEIKDLYDCLISKGVDHEKAQSIVDLIKALETQAEAIEDDDEALDFMNQGLSQALNGSVSRNKDGIDIKINK